MALCTGDIRKELGSDLLRAIERVINDNAGKHDDYYILIYSDWEGRGNIGGSLFGSCWPEVSMLLTAVELPGIYVQPDTGLLCVLDHVEARLLGAEDEAARLEVRNPTAFDAEVRVLADRSMPRLPRPAIAIESWSPGSTGGSSITIRRSPTGRPSASCRASTRLIPAIVSAALHSRPGQPGGARRKLPRRPFPAGHSW